MSARIGIGLLLLLAACGGTGGAEVPFEMRVEALTQDDAPAGTFTTDTGWTVELEEASLHLAAIYLWENPPPLAHRFDPRRIWDLVVPRAHAHAGNTHFNGGAVLGEHVGFVAWDALTGALSLGELVGNEGRVQSVSVLLEPPSDDDGPTRGHIAWARGTATKDGETVRFAGGLDLERSGRDRRVDGLLTDGTITSGATFVLQVDVGRWFRDADFSTLVEEMEDGTKTITPDTQVRAAWFLGARSADAFRGRWLTQ